MLGPPDAAHWFGTDHLGRDVWTRVVHGAGHSLTIGVAATALAVAGGVLLGLLAGLTHRIADEALSRTFDALSAFPELLLALLFIAIAGPGTASLIIAIGIATLPHYARVVRGQTLVVRRAGYVEQAVTFGQSRPRLVLRHVLPNVVGPVPVLAMIGLGEAILAAAGLSFLGMGPQPPSPEWGAMLSEGRNYLQVAWWISILPGLAVTATVVSLTVVGRHWQAPLRRAAALMAPLVTVEDLHVDFDTPTGRVAAVRGISFTVERGECVAVVGESGSGKSVTARTLVGLAGPGARVRAARLELAGRDVRRPPATGLAAAFVAGSPGWCLQDALVSLDPLRTVGRRDRRGAHHPRRSSAAANGPAGSPSCSTGRTCRSRNGRGPAVPAPALRRAAAARADRLGDRRRAGRCSSPTSRPPRWTSPCRRRSCGCSPSARAAGVSLLLISHDLAVVAQVADRVLVMRDGRIVEQGPTDRLLRAPEHQYTRQLLAAVPSATSRGRRLAGPARAGDARATLPARPEVRADDTVLDATGLTKRYGEHTVVRDVSFTIARGETLGLVGESGSGKSTVARIVAGLLDVDAGAVTFEETPWAGVPERARRPLRRRLQLISQDPLSSFDPRYSVGRAVAENLGPEVGRADRREHVVDLLRRVGLGADLFDRHPRQLSGGQRQRVAIARAIAPRPSLIICDEPVSALDVSVQAQVLDLLAELRATDGTALLFISHDLGVVHHLSDRVLVMHQGAVVEQGPVGDVFTYPRHDYTRSLLNALPTLVTAGRPEERHP